MKIKFLYVIFISLFFSKISKSDGRVGIICSSDAECGANEICHKPNFIQPACKVGKCQCAQCHDVNSDGDCSPIKKLKIGDTCDPANSNHKYPANAVCSSSNTVKCSWGWIEFGNACVRNQSATYGAPCRLSSDCSIDMWCNETLYCSCYYAYDKYDPISDRCVKKNFLDDCRTDGECRVYGKDWNGYTYSSGQCQDGRCECSSSGKIAIVGYIDDVVHRKMTKPICVTSLATINVEMGKRCTVDPLYYGDTPTINVCGYDSICYQCPEDIETSGYGLFDGKCRNFTQTEFVDYSDCLTQPEELVEYFIEIADEGFLESSGVIEDIQSEDSVTTEMENTTPTIRRCSSDSDCFSNERCLVSALCLLGLCVCNQHSGVDSSCLSAENFQTSSAAKKSLSHKWSRKVEVEDFGYGKSCLSDEECWELPGTECLLVSPLNSLPERKCLCPPKMSWFNESSCRPDTSGDSCNSDSDCNSGLYSFSCINNRCDCSSGHVKTLASIVKATWTSDLLEWIQLSSLVTPEYFCIQENVTIEYVGVNRSCTVDIVKQQGIISICQSELSCLHCPGDDTSGVCSDLYSRILPPERNQTIGNDTLEIKIALRSGSDVIEVGSTHTRTYEQITADLTKDDDKPIKAKTVLEKITELFSNKALSHFSNNDGILRNLCFLLWLGI